MIVLLKVKSLKKGKTFESLFYDIYYLYLERDSINLADYFVI